VKVHLHPFLSLISGWMGVFSSKSGPRYPGERAHYLLNTNVPETGWTKMSLPRPKNIPHFFPPPPPANSLITSPTYLLQKLEAPLPYSQTVTSGTTVSSVYITTQGPPTFLSRGHLESLTAVRAQSCWDVKLTFHFQLYTS